MQLLGKLRHTFPHKAALMRSLVRLQVCFELEEASSTGVWSSDFIRLIREMAERMKTLRRLQERLQAKTPVERVQAVSACEGYWEELIDPAVLRREVRVPLLPAWLLSSHPPRHAAYSTL